MLRFIPGLCAALLLGLGCIHPPPRPKLDFGPGGPLTRAEDVLLRLESQEASVHRLKGDGRLTVDSPQGKGSFSVLIGAADGGQVRMDALDFFGRPASSLSCDGHRFGLFQSQEGRYYRGPASAENLGRFLPVPLTPDDLAGILLGRVPRLSDIPVGPLEIDAAEAAYRIVLRRGTAEQTLWIDPRRFRVQKSQVRGARAYDVRIEEWSEDARLPFPRQLTLETGKQTGAEAHTSLTLHYGEISLNGPPEPALFSPKPPANVPVVEVDAHGTPLE